MYVEGNDRLERGKCYDSTILGAIGRQARGQPKGRIRDRQRPYTIGTNYYTSHVMCSKALVYSIGRVQEQGRAYERLELYSYYIPLTEYVMQSTSLLILPLLVEQYYSIHSNSYLLYTSLQSLVLPLHLSYILINPRSNTYLYIDS